MWKVELISGEILTLIDKGKVWEIVKDEKELEKRKVAKKVSAVEGVSRYRANEPLC